MIDPEDIEKSAARPWSIVEVGCHAGFHQYIVDATGRKIACVWGPTAQKPYTAALIVAAVNAIDAAPPVDASIEEIGNRMRALHSAMDAAGIKREPVFRR